MRTAIVAVCCGLTLGAALLTGLWISSLRTEMTSLRMAVESYERNIKIYRVYRGGEDLSLLQPEEEEG